MFPLLRHESRSFMCRAHETQPCAFFIFIFIAQHLWKREGKKPTNIWDGADEGPHCSAATSLSSRQQTQCEAVSFLSSTLPLIYFFLSRTVADLFFFFSFYHLPPKAACDPSHLSLPFIFILFFFLTSSSRWGRMGGEARTRGLHFVALCRSFVLHLKGTPSLPPPPPPSSFPVGGGSSLLWSWCLCLDNCAYWLWRAVPPACAESQHAVFHFASL